MLLVVGAFVGDKGTRPVALGAGLVLVASAAAACFGPQGAAFNNGFVEDQAAVFAKVVIYLISAVGLIIVEPWLKRISGSRFEYPILVLLAALGTGMMVSAGNLISLYIGVELQSLALYVLAAFRRDDPRVVRSRAEILHPRRALLRHPALRRQPDIRLRRLHPLHRHRRGGAERGRAPA